MDKPRFFMGFYAVLSASLSGGILIEFITNFLIYKTMDLSQFDLLDKISAYCWQHKTTYKQGHEIEYSAVAMDDIKQAFGEVMNDTDFFRIISKNECLEVEEIDILNKKFEVYKEISDAIKVYSSGDYLLYFNFRLKTMTIYELDIEDNKKYPILKKAKVKSKMDFDVIMNSLNFGS